MGVTGVKRARPDSTLTKRTTPDIHGTQVLQRFGQLGRPKRPVTSDVNSPQKNDERHLISSAS
jgi:hypothetical protein